MAQRLFLALTTDQDDRSLVQNSPEAFERIFHAYWPKISALVAGLLDKDEAEDVALEVFWRLYQRPWQWADTDALRGWLYRVALNLGLNTLRSRRRRQQYETQAGSLIAQNLASAQPEAAVEHAQERQQVRRILARMKPRSAQLLILRYSGHSYAEIAAALNLRLTSIGTLLARAEKEFADHYRGLDH
jgi:RNA polymerase sigma-70 factor (ECF subfamily)